MDEADRAERDTEIHMRAALLQRKPTLSPKGACHFCDEPAAPPRLFCSAECRGDYERLKRRIERN